MAQGPRFRRAHKLDEAGAFHFDAFVERLADGGLYRVYALERRREGTGDTLGHVAGELEVGFLVRVVDLDVADALQRPLFGDHLVGKSECALEQVAFDELVEQRGGLELFRSDRIAGKNHVECGLDADHARHALRAAGTGQQAELHFGQADLGVLARNAVVTTQRDFQTTAQGGAVNDRDAWLAAVLDAVDDVRQARRLRRFAEFLDVRAGDKGIALADQRHGQHLGIGVGRLEGLLQALAHRLAERIHGRVIDDDQGDRAVSLQSHELCHAILRLLL